MTIQTLEQAHAKAKALRAFLAANGCTLGHRKTLDAVAVVEGFQNWNTLSARLKASSLMAGPNDDVPAIQIRVDLSDDLDELWYARLPGETVEMGPFFDAQFLVTAVEDRLKDPAALAIDYEDPDIYRFAIADCSVWQDYGQYTAEPVSLTEALRLARSLRDSGAGGTWTVQLVDTERVIALFR